MPRQKRPTLTDLADAVGLSVNTVSRALTQKDGVSSRTREAVAREAERIGYVSPSRSARGSTKVVALTVTSSINVFILRLIPAVETALRAQGYDMVLHITEESADVENAVIAGMLEAEPAGAIVIPVQGDASGWTDAGELPFPVVAVAREIPGRDGDFVAMDQHAAMYAATRHALAQGARSLYFFDEDIDTMTNRIRVESFESAVRAVPEASGHVVPMPTRRFENRTSPWQLEEAYRAVSALLESDAAPDAMLFEDDYHAVGALRALAERGVRVPDDVLVVGYSDHPYTAYLQPSLTTVDVPFDLIAEAAVSLLLRRIAGDRTPPLRRLIPGELVVRESSVRQTVDPTPTM